MSTTTFRLFCLTIAFVLSFAAALVSGLTITEVCAFSAFIIAVDSWVNNSILRTIVGAMIGNKEAGDVRKAE